MNIVLIGASGYIGSGLLQEALARGHRVTAVVTNVAKLDSRPNLTPIAVDVQDTAALAAGLRGHDAVLSAFSGHAQPDVDGIGVRVEDL